MDALEYTHIPQLFLELRGRGVTLSAMDAEILWRWKQQQIPASMIMDTMMTMADEFLSRGRPFPASLGSVDKRLQHLLLAQQD